MRAGQLRERVAIQTNTPSQDDYGQPVESWATTATVWARVEAVGGSESARGGEQQVIAEASHRIVMRWRSLSVEQRLVWSARSRTFEVLAVLDGTGKRTVVALCREVQ